MESTQDRIVAASRTLFGQRGYQGTTTAEIARTAGVAEGTIYRYFKDKKELFVASVRPVVMEAVRREMAVVDTGTPRENMRRRIMERTRVIRENLEIFDIIFTEGKHHPEIAQALLGQLSENIPLQEWERAGLAVQGGAMKRPPNPLIMTVGLTAAIWAMLSVGAAADALFAECPFPVQFGDLDTELADFVCEALFVPNES